MTRSYSKSTPREETHVPKKTSDNNPKAGSKQAPKQVESQSVPESKTPMSIRKPPPGLCKRHYGGPIVFAPGSNIKILDADTVKRHRYKKTLSEADMTELQGLVEGVLLYKEEDIREFKSREKMKALLKRCQKQAVKFDRRNQTNFTPTSVATGMSSKR